MASGWRWEGVLGGRYPAQVCLAQGQSSFRIAQLQRSVGEIKPHLPYQDLSSLRPDIGSHSNPCPPTALSAELGAVHTLGPVQSSPGDQLPGLSWSITLTPPQSSRS